MTPFYQTTHCASRLNCVICRAREKGAKWRAFMAEQHGLDPEAECPAGIPWDATREVVAQLTVKKLPLTATRIAHGAVGLAKAGIGSALNRMGATTAAKKMDRASEATIEARRATCLPCENNTRGPEKLGGCKLCTCNLTAKTSLAGEKCPSGKWGGENQQGAIT